MRVIDGMTVSRRIARSCEKSLLSAYIIRYIPRLRRPPPNTITLLDHCNACCCCSCPIYSTAAAAASALISTHTHTHTHTRAKVCVICQKSLKSFRSSLNSVRKPREIFFSLVISRSKIYTTSRYVFCTMSGSVILDAEIISRTPLPHRVPRDTVSRTSS